MLPLFALLEERRGHCRTQGGRVRLALLQRLEANDAAPSSLVDIALDQPACARAGPLLLPPGDSRQVPGRVRVQPCGLGRERAEATLAEACASHGLDAHGGWAGGTRGLVERRGAPRGWRCMHTKPGVAIRRRRCTEAMASTCCMRGCACMSEPTGCSKVHHIPAASMRSTSNATLDTRVFAASVEGASPPAGDFMRPQHMCSPPTSPERVSSPSHSCLQGAG